MMRRILLAAAVLGLAACGFTLRNEIALGPNLSVLRVETVDSFSPLQRNLEQALRRAGASVVDTAAGSGVLRILASRMERTPLSVGDTGRVQEFLLRYQIKFELVDAAAVTVLPRQSVELTRDYTFDTAQAFGTPGEEEVVRAELERDMVQAILRRIDAVSR